VNKETLTQQSSSSASSKGAKLAPPASLPKAQRLKTPADFQRVYKSKQWGGSSFHTFNILAAPVNVNQHGDGNRQSKTHVKPTVLGVTVSKKVSKRAVDRNRIKRQIREFYRHRKAALPNTELIITANVACIKASDEQRHQSLELLWEKILKWQRWHLKQTAISTQGLIENTTPQAVRNVTPSLD